MSQTVARITCPSCKQPFAAPLEQILDVEVDPSAKVRLLSGQVNVVICPHCGARGAVSLPFLYHDPSKELALVFLPMEAGRSDMERQQVIGALSRAVMNQLPPEQRKGYLLNPQVFFSYDSLLKRVLEADGVTEEMLEAQKARVDLLRQLMEAEDREKRLALIEENSALLDEQFFEILQANLVEADAAGLRDLVRQFLDLRALLFERTEQGRRLAARTRALQALRDEPTREKLVDLLLESEDPMTREALIMVGQPLVDYFFFQTLTQRIEAAQSEEERKRLEAVREEVMHFRQEMQEQARQVLQSRQELVRDLLATEKPDLLVRRRLAQLDDLFFAVLGAEIERARQAGDDEMLSRLEEIWRLTMGVLEEQVPPELALLTAVLEAPDEEAVRTVLEANRRVINQRFVQLLEHVAQQLKEGGETAAAERIAAALEIVRPMVSAGKPEGEEPSPPSDKPRLEIARR